MSSTTFSVFRPTKRQTSVIFASPHSGRVYTPSFLKQAALDKHTIRSSEDAFVDDLFDGATAFGAPFIVAHAPRAFIDLNRAHDELDPALISGLRKSPQSARVNSGLGVIPRVVANGRHIYRGKISLNEANSRIANYWRPYHDALARLISESTVAFGDAILIDCHSMPNEALVASTRRGLTRPDVVLGDRFGGSCSPHIIDQVEAAFAKADFNVARNQPFAGAYIAQRYGRPAFRQHVVQIEINRSLYMDEKQIHPLQSYPQIKSRLNKVIEEISAIGRSVPQSIAAE